MMLLHSHGRGAIAVALGAVLSLALAAPAAAAKPVRPFFGQAKGVDTLVPILQPIAACPEGSMFYATEDGIGTFAHLGLVHYTLAQCAAVNWATGEGWLTKNGSTTIVAANGDRLLLSHSMTFTATPPSHPTTADSHLDWVVTGGTGRFAGATGSGQAHWSVVYSPDLSGAVSSSAWWGAITY